MNNKQLLLLKSVLGEHYLPLMKSIVKQASASVVDISELHDSLKIIPKAIMTFVMQATKDMDSEHAKEVKIPWEENAIMLINKTTDDVYKGHFTQDGKVVHEFELCSIPQLCAHLLSFSEMYDQVPDSEVAAEPEQPPQQDDIREHLKALDGKINALMMMIASQPIQKNETLEKGWKHAAAGLAAVAALGSTPKANADSSTVHSFITQGMTKIPGVTVQSSLSPDKSNGAFSVNYGKFSVKGKHGGGGGQSYTHQTTLMGPDQSTWSPKDAEDFKTASKLHSFIKDKMPALMDATGPIGKSEIDPKADKWKAFSKSLKKAGLAPGMPKPPRPGTNVGGTNGITKEGIHQDKTTATDAPGHEIHTQVKNPWNEKFNAGVKISTQPKQPKQPAQVKTVKSEKEVTFKKSELAGQCTDCGQPLPHCACFRALSQPIIKKSDNDKVTLGFKSDWDSEATEALYKSITASKKRK